LDHASVGEAREARDALWGVTCTAYGAEHLRTLAPTPERVTLAYHGLDLSRFPKPPRRPARDGSDAADPVRIVCVGRLVAKKGIGDLLKALAALPLTCTGASPRRRRHTFAGTKSPGGTGRHRRPGRVPWP
jgi:glycosyltransferase involved in cell wall biosynthesis